MQSSIRENGAPMGDEGHGGFVRLHREGLLVKPELPSHVIAALALKGPKTLSGQFVSWDDDVCKEFMV